MKINKYLTGFLISILMPLSSVSCADFSQSSRNKLSQKILLLDEVSEKTIDKNKTKTEDILNRILNQLFKGNKIKILDFLNSQKINEKIILEKFIQNQKEFSNLDDNNSRIEFAKKQREFFSKNWYFFLTHINQFEFNFLEYVFDGLQNGNTASEEYKKIIQNKKNVDTFSFQNIFLEKIRVGDESIEISNTNIYYILKEKMVFRLSVNDLDQDQPTINILPMIWYFPESKAKSISLALVSSIVHTLFIHNYPSAFSEFEEVMVKEQRYGSPIFVFPTILFKGAENEKK
ncbi:hypothetical protein JXZ92_02465 [Mycoplasma sp. CSL10137]|uniref:aromatic motif membrane protein n=1 Tax=unclassified Mycoplasma TaxID=2683645 RepID=UPI00197B7D34|nr:MULTISPECIES: aromatic motif membrane protein [unclassified Mycoplasma]MBN4083673.1 hypothetical protein [Mycoplasma sp. CSL10137]MBN4084694.1 hypothetical protein [Mycoplasma sp. CSL10166]MBU4693172.1 hypothetical protein [Mycoplasma sp. CSL7491-lung]